MGIFFTQRAKNAPFFYTESEERPIVYRGVWVKMAIGVWVRSGE
jgi:hypothetical protein